MKKLLSIILTLAMLISAVPAMGVSAEAGEYNVVWLGGSFTESITGPTSVENGFPALVTKWMNENNYAGTGVSVNGINAGVGGTGAEWGRVRYESDVLAKNPDLVVVEFNGNDSGASDKTKVMNAFESMIRRTIAEKPNAKMVLLLRPDYTSTLEANAYYKHIADYYKIPTIDISESVKLTRDLVVDDECHPNDKGHAAIAQGIIDWLSKNAVNKPAARQFPVDTDYSPIIPTEYDIKDYYDSAKTTGWYVNTDGALQSDTAGDVLMLKIKGSMISLVSNSASTGRGSFVCDSNVYTSGTTEYERSERKESVANGRFTQAVNLRLGSGEHVITIKNTNGTLVLSKIVLDGIENSNLASNETKKYSVFKDKSSITKEDTNYANGRGTTDNGGRIQAASWAQIWGQGPARGVIGNGNPFYVEYDLPSDKVIGTVGIQISRPNKSTLNSYYTNAEMSGKYVIAAAIGENGIETKIPVLAGSVIQGYSAEKEENNYSVDEYMGYGIPVGTKKIRIYVYNLDSNLSAAPYVTRFSELSYTYADNVALERTELNVGDELLVGNTSTAVLKAYNNDGTEYSLTDENIIYYTTDTNVINVDANTGVVTAAGAGKGTVYAEVTIDGKTYTSEKMITVYDLGSITDSWFTLPKTNYIKGTTEKINLCSVINDETKINTIPAAYATSNDKVIAIDENGNMTATGAGTAEITMSAPILNKTVKKTITVYEGTELKSNIAADITAGAIDASKHDRSYFKNADTKLYLWGAYQDNLRTDGDYVTASGNTKDANNYIAFIYKLNELNASYDEIPNKIAFNVHTNLGLDDNWGTGNKNQGGIGTLRGEYFPVAYISEEKAAALLGDSGKALTSDEVLGSDVSKLLIDGYTNDGETAGYPETGIKFNSDWTVDKTATITQDGGNGDYYTVSTAIPENAAYVAIMGIAGKRYSATEDLYATSAHYVGVCGMTYSYDARIAATEVTDDDKLAITYSKDMQNPALTITVDGAAVTPSVTYDEKTYTSYVDVSEFNNKTLAIAVEGLGTTTVTVPDNREQITSIKLTDGSGSEITDTIGTDVTEINVSAAVSNTNEEKIYVIAAVYTGDNLEKADVIGMDTPQAANGTAVGKFKLTFDEGYFETPKKLKVFCWKTNMSPFENYLNLQSEFSSEDF